MDEVTGAFALSSWSQHVSFLLWGWVAYESFRGAFVGSPSLVRSRLALGVASSLIALAFLGSLTDAISNSLRGNLVRGFSWVFLLSLAWSVRANVRFDRRIIHAVESLEAVRTLAEDDDE